jgi:glycosyltransferase involved in cell wall biosynthesis
VKVAFFTHPFAPIVGGIESSVATFAEDLRALGHEVLIVTSTRGTSSVPEHGLLRTSPLADRDRLFPASDRDRLFRAPDRDRLFPALDAFGPDLIHVHQPFLLGRRAQDYATSRRLPLVFTHHTLYHREEDRAHLGEFAELESATRELAIAFSGLCDAVVAPTGSIAGHLRDQGVAGPIAVVPTGIDTTRFALGDGAGFRKRHGLPAGAFVVGHLGRLVPAKRIAFLVEAIVAFLSGAPDAVALICGEGEMAAPLADAFHEAGLSDRLFLRGRLDEGEIADAYAAMDVFTFASLTDTQGLVLLEAMAAGVPVLALRATGPQDVVTDGVSGRLLDPASKPADFARTLADFRDSPDLSRFASEARRRSFDFDRRACAGAMLTVYEEAAATFRDRTRDPSDRDLASLHERVEREWLRFADRPAASQALLPTRGFPSFPDPA